MTSRLKSAAGAVLSGASRMEKRSETRKNWRESFCMKYLLVSYLKHLYTPDLRVSIFMASLRNRCALCVSAVKMIIFTAETQRAQRLRRETGFEVNLVGVAAAYNYADSLARPGLVSTGKKGRKSSSASGLRDNSH